MPRITSRKGLAGILQSIRNEASSAADELERVGGEVESIAQGAERLSRIQAPATFSPPTPRPFTPIVGVDGSGAGGSVIGGRRTTSAGAGTVGSGASGSGRTRVQDPFLTSHNTGEIRQLSWIKANCRLVEQELMGPFGSPFGRRIPVWDCGTIGSFVDPSGGGVLSSMSKTSSGGAAHTAVGIRRDSGPGRLFGRPVGGTGIHGRLPPFSEVGIGGDPQGSSGGLTSGGQGLSSPGVETTSRLDRIINNQERALRGDGGTGLRAGGLI